MNNVIVVPINRDPVALVEHVKFEMGQHGQVFSGDSKSGTFLAAKVSGTYTMTENEITITIVYRPFYIPYQIVEMAAYELFS